MSAPIISAPPTPTPPRRKRTSVFAFLLLLILIAALVVEWQWLAPIPANDARAADAVTLRNKTAPPDPNRPRLIPFTDVNPYGVNIFLQNEVEDYKKALTIQQVSELGAGWVKQQFPWDELEFKKGCYFDARNNKDAWAKFDDIVARAEAAHLRVIARLDHAPYWARAKDRRYAPVGDNPCAAASLPTPAADPNPGAPPTDYQDYADFVATFVKHYRGRINFIQIWNEPNLNREWIAAQPVDPAAYTRLLKTAYLRAKQTDPNVAVLAAPLAMTTEQPDLAGNMEEMSYLNAMYVAGAAPYFDIMSANGYGLNDPPNTAPSFDRLNFARVSLLRGVMQQNHDEMKPIWFNEYGWNAAPDSIPAAQRIWGQVSREQQATYTVQGIEAAAGQQWDWAGVFTIWYFRQVGNIPPTSAEYYFDMVNVDFTKEPVYGAVKAAAQRWLVSGAGYHEELSGGVQPNKDWPLRLDQAASGHAYLAAPPATEAAPLRLTFVGNQLDLITYGPTAKLYLALDGGSNGLDSALPRDGQGVYLAARDKGGRVTVVSGLSDQLPLMQHTLTLASSGGGKLGGGLDAYVVAANRSHLLFYALTGGLALAIIVTALFLRRSLRGGSNP